MGTVERFIFVSTRRADRDVLVNPFQIKGK